MRLLLNEEEIKIAVKMWLSDYKNIQVNTDEMDVYPDDGITVEINYEK